MEQAPVSGSYSLITGPWQQQSLLISLNSIPSYKQSHWKDGCQDLGERKSREFLSGYRVSGLQDEKSSGALLPNNVNMLSTTELYT